MKHYKQKTSGSCSHTCIAMLADVDPKFIRAAFAREPMNPLTIDTALSVIGMERRLIPQPGQGLPILFGQHGWYWLVVSDERPHRTHSILIEIRHSNEQGLILDIYDPKADDVRKDVPLYAIFDHVSWFIIEVYSIQEMMREDFEAMQRAMINAREFDNDQR